MPAAQRGNRTVYSSYATDPAVAKAFLGIPLPNNAGYSADTGWRLLHRRNSNEVSAAACDTWEDVPAEVYSTLLGSLSGMVGGNDQHFYYRNVRNKVKPGYHTARYVLVAGIEHCRDITPDGAPVAAFTWPAERVAFIYARYTEEVNGQSQNYWLSKSSIITNTIHDLGHQFGINDHEHGVGSAVEYAAYLNYATMPDSRATYATFHPGVIYPGEVDENGNIPIWNYNTCVMAYANDYNSTDMPYAPPHFVNAFCSMHAERMRSYTWWGQ